MSDDEIIELYFARDERALAQTERKYGPYCFSLANNILASPEDAEETVSDTYLKAWQTIPPKRPGVLRMYLAKITRNLALSRWRGLTARKRSWTPCPGESRTSFCAAIFSPRTPELLPDATV